MNEHRIELPKTILFVCTGNTCRSAMARGIFRKMLKEVEKENIKLTSAGTIALPGMKPPREVEEVMKGEGIDISHHQATPLTRNLIEEADLILVMDRCHRKTILKMSPGASQKTFLLKEFSPDPGEGALDISDPLGGSLRTYEKAFREIKRCLEELLKKVDWYLSALTGREEHG